MAAMSEKQSVGHQKGPRSMTARALALTALGVCLAGVGAYLAAGHGSYSRHEWIRMYLEIVGGQLAELRGLVVEYKKTHGRYPTNDEGLAVLDNFESRFKATLPALPEEAPGQAVVLHPWLDDYFWFTVRETLGYFRQDKGRAPRDAAEFSDVLPDYLLARARKDNAWQVQMDLGITRTDNILVLSPAGVLSPWFIPYVYENRTGADPASFVDSLATRDQRGWCLARVDERVFVYSVAAQFYAKRYDEEWWDYNGPRFLGAGLLVLALGSFVLLVRSTAWGSAKGMAAILVSGALGYLTSEALQVSCYAARSLFHRRDPQMLTQQRELLEKYRNRGVIAEATYKKAVAALENPLEAGTKNTSEERK